MCEQKDAIAAMGAEVILIAYDEPSLLGAKILRGVDVPFDLLLDRDKRVYREWGMGRTTLAKSVLSPKLTWRYLKLLAAGERFLGLAPDMLQLGGDFVVDPAGVVTFGYRMRDNGDRAPVPSLLRALADAR